MMGKVHTVMAVAVDLARGEIGTPGALFGWPDVFHAAWDEGRSYDASADGERFLICGNRRLAAGSWSR